MSDLQPTALQPQPRRSAVDDLPLADLHRHIDGSLRPKTVADIAAQLGLQVPTPLAFSPGMGLDAALACFSFTVSLLQTESALAQVASEACEDARAEGITTLELRFAPQLHGMELARAIDAVLDGVAGRAGVILCGLFGDPPALLEALVDLARARPGVVGLDLAGGPTPHHIYGMKDYAPAFSAAAKAGLGRTVHAGEGRPPAEIRVAIEALHAQRIGHGTTLLDDPSIVALVLERGVVIEACPTSNWHTGVIAKVGEHPLVRWLERGIRCTVNTDNTLLSQVTLPEELTRVAMIPGFTPVHLRSLLDTAHAAAFR